MAINATGALDRPSWAPLLPVRVLLRLPAVGAGLLRVGLAPLVGGLDARDPLAKHCCMAELGALFGPGQLLSHGERDVSLSEELLFSSMSLTPEPTCRG